METLKTERELLMDVFDFFQVPVEIITSTSVEHFHTPIEAAGRRYAFNNKGGLARVVANGKIVDVFPEDD